MIFILLQGYKSNVIKKFLKNLKKGNSKSEVFLDGKPCTITLLDTGSKNYDWRKIKIYEKLFE